MANALRALLPQHEGLLPWWLLVTSIASMFNTYQSYTTMFYARRLFAGIPPRATQSEDDVPEAKLALPESHPLAAHWPIPPWKTGPTVTVNSPITPFGARSFGSWNFLVGIIRFYAAYHIDNPEVFQLVMWSYAVSLTFIASEVFVYGTARVKSGWASMAIVGGSSLAWTVYGWWVGWYGNKL